MTFSRIVLILAFCLSAGAACRKRPETPAPTAQPGSDTTPASPAVPVPAPPAAPPASATPGLDKVEDRLPTAPPNSSRTLPVDKVMTEALHRHLEATGKLPSDFQALVSGKYLPSLPVPPAGKRHAVDRVHLQVVLLGQ